MLKKLVRVLLLAASVCAAPVQAQEKFPSKPITIIVPSTSGGSVEFQTRILGELFREKHGQNWVLELRPGAMGATGATYASRAPADGYTLLASPNSPIVFNPLTHKNLSYDPTKFTPIGLMSTQPLVMATRGDFPGNSMQDLIEYAKKNPDRTYYASQGIGGGNHMSALLLESYTKTRMKHVPFPGAGPASQALQKGEVDFFMAPLAQILPWYRDKSLKMFAMGSPQRHPDAPDVPTFRELGYPEDFVLTVWSVLVGPPGMAPATADWLNAAINDLLKSPIAIERFKALGVDPGGGSRAELAAFFNREFTTWERVARENNIEKQ